MNIEAPMISVYVLDDHEIVREGICDSLRNDPYITLLGNTGDGQTAIKDIIQLNPDVAVLDIHLKDPELSGFEVTQRIKESKPNQTIILLTGFDSRLQADEALRMGINGFVTKERSRRVLSLAIQLVSQGMSVWDTKVFDGVVKLFSTKAKSNASVFASANIIDLELTEIEKMVIKLLKKGCTNKNICKELQLSEASVKKHVHNCIRKLGVTSRVQVALIDTVG